MSDSTPTQAEAAGTLLCLAGLIGLFALLAVFAGWVWSAGVACALLVWVGYRVATN